MYKQTCTCDSITDKIPMTVCVAVDNSPVPMETILRTKTLLLQCTKLSGNYHLYLTCRVMNSLQISVACYGKCLLKSMVAFNYGIDTGFTNMLCYKQCLLDHPIWHT